MLWRGDGETKSGLKLPVTRCAKVRMEVPPALGNAGKGCLYPKSSMRVGYQKAFRRVWRSAGKAKFIGMEYYYFRLPEAAAAVSKFVQCASCR